MIHKTIFNMSYAIQDAVQYDQKSMWYNKIRQPHTAHYTPVNRHYAAMHQSIAKPRTSKDHM